MNLDYDLFQLDESKFRSFAISKVLSIILFLTLIFTIYTSTYYLSGDELDRPISIPYSHNEKLWLYSITALCFMYFYNLQERIGNLKNIILQINNLKIKNVMISNFVQDRLIKHLIKLQLIILAAIMIPILLNILACSFWFSFFITFMVICLVQWEIKAIMKFIAINEKESADKYVKIDLSTLKHNLQYKLLESL